jgi:hypothetical protein
MSYMRPVYTSTARFDETARALTEDELRKLAPSVFAVAAHESRSDRFQPIPTIEVLRGLAAEGFSVVGATQSKARDTARTDFTKHLLRLRRLDDKTHRVDDVLPEVILRNANDGTAAYELMAGLFRIRCLNSLVAQVATLDSTKVRHSGSGTKVRDAVIEGTHRVIDAAQKALQAPAAWSEIVLDREEKLLLASTVFDVRFPRSEEETEQQQQDRRVRHTIDAARLLEPARYEDRKDDLWTVTNVLQERAVRGGQHYTRTALDGNDRLTQRNARTREVKGVDQLVGVNKAIFRIAEFFAEQRGVKLAA